MGAYQMNPQRAAFAAQAPAQPSADQEQGDGTQASGYVTPDLGPFECENCQHFTAPSNCNHPTVQADPQVQGQVDPEGCCNFFKSAHNETQAEEHGENLGESNVPNE